MHKITLQKVPGIVIERYESNGEFPITLVSRSKGARCCAQCDSKAIRKRWRKVRRVRHTDFDGGPCYLVIHGHKYECLACRRYFNEGYDGIRPRRRYTEMYRKDIVNMHQLGINQTHLRRWKGVGSATIERWYHDFLDVQVRHWTTYQCPEYIGIDEHSFSRKHRQFATTICDVSKRRIMDILPDTSFGCVSDYFKQFHDTSRLKMVNMDLSDSFRSIIKGIFPHVRIVADRFHVIRIVNHHFLKTWHLIDPDAKYHRRLLAVMRRHEWDLSDSQLHIRNDYFRRFPQLKPIYDFKQDLSQ